LLENKTRRQITREAKIQDEDQKYRLRQFYKILLQADKARLLSLQTNKGADDAQGLKGA
jgi:hypothetical protein